MRHGRHNRYKLPVFAAATALAIGATACSEGGKTSAETPPLSQPRPTAPTSSVSTVSTKPNRFPIGYDVSWAQCGETLPATGAFGIIQITFGRANVLSPESCFQQQIHWAQGLSGETSQPKVGFYLWPANPGSVYRGQKITDWPTNGSNRYGNCSGSDGPACSYEYGLERGRVDLAYAQKELGSHSLGTVYIDVESGIGNEPGTWQTTSHNNLAAIQGFAAAIHESGNTPGIYSDSNQLRQVLNSEDSVTLADLPEWITGGGTVQGAQENCSAPFIKGGKVVLSQYIQDRSGAVSPIDLDYAC